jgi:hypothetical protein
MAEKGDRDIRSFSNADFKNFIKQASHNKPKQPSRYDDDDDDDGAGDGGKN